MIKARTNRVTRRQFEKMADFLEKYPQMFRGVTGSDFEKSFKDQLWRDLAAILNAEDGPQRSAVKWRKCLKDYKCYLKKKYLTYLADTSTLSPLSYLDVRYLGMMGYVVDVEGTNYSNNDLETIMLKEINGDIVAEIVPVREYQEQSKKNYQAPAIITLMPKAANSTPMETQDGSENAPIKESSKNVEGASSSNASPNNKKTQNKEESSCNEELPHIEESSCNEESVYTEKSPTKKSPPSKKPKHKKQASVVKKKHGGNSTAAALQAIAKELNAKNELTKMKIELEKEKMILETRKIEAFELIAKGLQKV